MDEIKTLFPKDIDPENDIYLGETSVQIKGFHDGYPSIHLVKSYIKRVDNSEHFYHIFEHKTGTSAMNYGPRQYEQVANYLDISDYWTIFYKDDTSMMPINKSWRYE
ncbi:hypothetical protein ACJ2A9_21205 [Anaerobacillus sp. MEB173]|uniref:hypothetical protein n=1 Tax=Anaerobacillus sp. MEB173 TaxID=3383345 RepID=UPI003F908027